MVPLSEAMRQRAPSQGVLEASGARCWRVSTVIGKVEVAIPTWRNVGRAGGMDCGRLNRRDFSMDLVSRQWAA